MHVPIFDPVLAPSGRDFTVSHSPQNKKNFFAKAGNLFGLQHLMLVVSFEPPQELILQDRPTWFVGPWPVRLYGLY
jgi:hypothetical protein